MKENEAPEKLYVNIYDHLTQKGYYAFTNKVTEDDIEYIRKDAFMRKMNDSELLLLVRSLPGVHFREDNHNWITIREDILMQVIEKIIKGEKVSFI